MSRFKRGDIVYFIRSASEIVPAQVLGGEGRQYTLRFHGREKGAYSGIRLLDDRLYASREEAEKKARIHGRASAAGRGFYRDTHWDPEYR